MTGWGSSGYLAVDRSEPRHECWVTAHMGELVAADRLDELCLTIAPLMGGDALPIAVTPPSVDLAPFALRGTMVADDTLFLRYERGTRRP